MRTTGKCVVRFALCLTLSILASCRDVVEPVTVVVRSGQTAQPDAASHVAGTATVYVANAEQLYEAVEDPANASARIVLAPGTYVLSATNAAMVPRPHAGRLELQDNMSLHGVSGDRGAVVIDARGLPVTSLTVALGRTGPVRIGRGTNSVEWLTILGSAAAVAGIETDLAGSSRTAIRIANVVSAGSQRGLDIRNIGPSMAGRRIDAEVTGSDLSSTPAVQVGQGIRIVNMNGADGAVIVASLRGNRVHGSRVGCQLSNLVTSNAVISVESSGDRFVDNALGCLINGGIVTGTTGVANANTTVFEAHGVTIEGNTAPGFPDIGGMLVIGGESPARAGGTSENSVTVRLWGSTVARNSDPDLAIFGARGSTSSGIAGSDNRVRLELGGVSKRITPVETASAPSDPNRSNTVTVVR